MGPPGETERRLLERNEQLKVARDELAIRNSELREATRAKDRFMATMSHEMRTPLNAILGYVELLILETSGNLTDTQRSHLARISTSGRVLLDLINDVLDLTRAEAGLLGIESRLLSLEAVVEEAVEMVRPQAESRRLKLQIAPAGEVAPWVIADFRRVRQIVANILSNAVKFTHEGEITVEFTAPEPDVVGVAISDTGIGIRPDKLSHVFTEFYQGDSQLTREYGGTGLGLAISRRLARLMGGEIAVTSSEGKGSTFTLTLPAASAAQKSAHTAAPAGTAPRSGSGARPKAAVPVVAFGQDDDVLDALRLQLEPQVRLITTTMADLVPQLARRESASLIVLDVACQDGAGWEAAHAVREDGELDDVAMLLLPCFPDVIDGSDGGALDLGWVAVVPKPFTPEQLTRMVDRAVSKGGVPDSGARRILVVDDDADARNIAVRILTAAGAEVRQAPDGEAALSLMRSDPPDVAVLDLMMPVLDGFGVLAAMRSDPALQDVPVVVLTAKDLSEPERRFLSRTAETVLQKGIHPLADVATMVLEAAMHRPVRPANP
jgi:CheY-like chemotaxis protein/nitrogen-specific signal transduction histidine kinase